MRALHGLTSLLVFFYIVNETFLDAETKKEITLNQTHVETLVVIDKAFKTHENITVVVSNLFGLVNTIIKPLNVTIHVSDILVEQEHQEFWFISPLSGDEEGFGMVVVLWFEPVFTLILF